MATIGIFPASGALGSSTYNHLLSQVPNDKVILISRFPEKTPQKYLQNGVVTRAASYESTPEQLEAAFSDIHVLFLISYPSHQHALRTKLQLPVIDAAHRAGVKHLMYSSLGFSLPDKDTTKAEVMGAHLDSEAHLRKLAREDPAFSFTIVREGLYSESFPIYTAFFDITRPTAEIVIPHDGSGPGVSWVKRDELGEASARLIADCAKSPSTFEYRNKLVALTGPKEWSLAESVALFSRVTGADIRIREVTIDEYARQPQVLKRFGSIELAKTWATAWEAIRHGETAPVITTLREILGREPEAYETTIERLRQEHIRDD
jgi:uncharacterized protein YbjT (DUF2867 family)